MTAIRGWAVRHHHDIEAAGIWLATRVSVFLVAYVTSWTLGPKDGPLLSIEDQWSNWDAEWFADIAEEGYEFPRTAFLPAVPFLMRALGLLGLSATFAGLLVSLVAGVAAAVLVRRVAASWGYDGRWAVIVLATAPMTVFMSAPYTEALFLALALGAWLSAQHRRYVWMGVLAGAAVLTRANGIFLIVALAVLLATTRARVRDYTWLLIPVATFVGWIGYVSTLRGDWGEWLSAQRVQWGRELVDPFTAFSTSVTAALRPCSDPRFCWFSYNEMFMARMELLAAAVLVATSLWLLWRRRWPEATYVVLTSMAVLTSSWYFSLPRFLLAVWPVTLVIGLLLSRQVWARWLWGMVAVPMAVLWTAIFSVGLWAT